MRDAEALTEFLSESWELLDLLDRELVLLENETENTGVFNSVFRVMHTLKGNAGFLAFAGIEKVSHVSEFEDRLSGSEVTAELNKHVAEAARGSNQINDTVRSKTVVASENKAGADNTLEAARGLANQADELRGLLSNFTL